MQDFRLKSYSAALTTLFADLNGQAQAGVSRSTKVRKRWTGGAEFACNAASSRKAKSLSNICPLVTGAFFFGEWQRRLERPRRQSDPEPSAMRVRR